MAWIGLACLSVGPGGANKKSGFCELQYYSSAVSVRIAIDCLSCSHCASISEGELLVFRTSSLAFFPAISTRQ